MFCAGRLRSGKRKRSGQALVEFAVVVPVLLLLLLGLMEWGFLIWTKTTFENAVREGARNAVVVTDWSTNRTARETEIKTLVTTKLAMLPASERAGVSSRITVELLPSVSPISSIRVSIVNQPYSPIIGFIVPGLPATLNARAEFRYEGSM